MRRQRAGSMPDRDGAAEDVPCWLGCGCGAGVTEGDGMSREEIYRCDVCKKQRGETNHWFLIQFHVRDEYEASIQIFAWDDQLAEEDLFHLCGEGCVQRKVSEFIAKK